MFLWAFAPEFQIVSRRQEPSTPQDAHSKRLIVVGQGLAIFAAFAFVSYFHADDWKIESERKPRAGLLTTAATRIGSIRSSTELLRTKSPSYARLPCAAHRSQVHVSRWVVLCSCGARE